MRKTGFQYFTYTLSSLPIHHHHFSTLQGGNRYFLGHGGMNVQNLMEHSRQHIEACGTCLHAKKQTTSNKVALPLSQKPMISRHGGREMPKSHHPCNCMQRKGSQIVLSRRRETGKQQFQHFTKPYPQYDNTNVPTYLWKRFAHLFTIVVHSSNQIPQAQSALEYLTRKLKINTTRVCLLCHPLVM